MEQTSIIGRSRVEPTVARCEARYVRRQSVSACLLVVAVSTGLYGTLRSGVDGLTAAIIALAAAAAAFGFWVAATAALLRRPSAWPLYKLRERLRLPQLPLPFAFASLAGTAGAFVHLAVILLR